MGMRQRTRAWERTGRVSELLRLLRLFVGRMSGRVPAVPDRTVSSPVKPEIRYDPQFLDFIKIFAAIGSDKNLFPKKCRTCGQEYRDFTEYLYGTAPVGHGLEDCTDVMEVPYTLQYRNCACGSTLVLALTDDTFPILERFWQTLQQASEESGRPLRQVVAEFREQCNRYVIDQHLSEKEKGG